VEFSFISIITQFFSDKTLSMLMIIKKPFRSHAAYSAVLTFISLALSQTPGYIVRPCIWCQCIRWYAYLLRSFHWYSLLLHREGRPGLSWPWWLVTYWDGSSARRWSPIQVLTQQRTAAQAEVKLATCWLQVRHP